MILCCCFPKNAIDHTTEEAALNADPSRLCVANEAQVDFLPQPQPIKPEVHKFGSKSVEGIGVGYHQGSGGSWSKDLVLLVAVLGQRLLNM